MTLPQSPPGLVVIVGHMTPEKPEKPHRILREVLRHYLTFEDLCKQSGKYEIEYAGFVLSFLDLQGCLRSLSKRKMEAVWMNVVLDMKQKDVADIMKIRTVTVGQYVDQGMEAIAEAYYLQQEWDAAEVALTEWSLYDLGSE